MSFCYQWNVYYIDCSGHHLLFVVVDHPEIREDVANKNEQLAGFLKGMVVNPERMGEVRDVSVATVSMFFFLIDVWVEVLTITLGIT